MYCYVKQYILAIDKKIIIQLDGTKKKFGLRKGI